MASFYTLITQKDRSKIREPYLKEMVKSKNQQREQTEISQMGQLKYHILNLFPYFNLNETDFL